MNHKRTKLNQAKKHLEKAMDLPYSLDGLIKAMPSIFLSLKLIIEVIDDLSEL